MDPCIFPPSEKLNPFIKFYWYMESESCSEWDSRYRIIPNGCPCLMVHYGDRLIEFKGNNVPEQQPPVVLSGQTTKYYDVGQKGITGFISILFKPHALKLFFDQPAGITTDNSLDLSLLANSESDSIYEKIGTSRNIQERISIIEEYLMKRIIEKHLYNFRRIGICIDKVTSSRACVQVAELADIACFSSRQFDRVFIDFVGIRPKEFLRIVRLQNVIHKAYYNKNESLSSLAYSCGYYDQAHMNHEFLEFTGMNPLQGLRDCSSPSDYFTTF